MPTKYILLASVFTMFATLALGQESRRNAAANKNKIARVDTVIVIKKGKTNPPALPIALAMPKITKPGPKVYKPVPLAHQSEYYGSMSGYVNEFVNKYSRSHNKTINVVQDRSNKQFPLMENVLQKHEIPKELKYLAVIESALNNNAISRAGAVGPWQLMAPTARLMGLKVSKGRDDRKDWYKSTNAAAKYLTYLYDELNDWLLVVAAYNSGPTPVKRAIERTGSNNFWDIKKYLPKETQGHVLAFIATATIFENVGKFIGKEDNTAVAAKAGAAPAKPRFTQEELQNMAILKIKDPLSMDLMVLELGLDARQMDNWNEDYELFEYQAYPDEMYSLRIPKDKVDAFMAKKEYLIRKSKAVFSAQNM
ncbi:hypothetical protein CAP35_08530 [Chitinophagaceae bacterium IBVUCB1]|nr:hypothetical protein CAP35_08530 [Chitinophagaceae bacterium IBVUCB1]